MDLTTAEKLASRLRDVGAGAVLVGEAAMHEPSARHSHVIDAVARDRVYGNKFRWLRLIQVLISR